MSDERGIYCISGPGFTGEYACLHEALTVLQTHHAGAVYQRLWHYESFSPGLLEELQCNCERCCDKRRA